MTDAVAGCFCATGADTLCARCEGVPVLAKAHHEGRERLAGRNPLPMSAGDAGEMEWRSWKVPITRHGDRVRD